jgi:hypothetical protein
MKIHAQPGRPPIPCMFWMAVARSPPGSSTVRDNALPADYREHTEGASYSGRGEEEGDSCSQLGALVPAIYLRLTHLKNMGILTMRCKRQYLDRFQTRISRVRSAALPCTISSINHSK